ncbi:zf-HC2 domain-containing protein [Streptomyces sp. NPDC053427]|uniref:zf-HC2 domain-containing protein n=1 Tax=Streptomyces sp. NPDC053427 TaxID=3365701 RepID=UPI0037D04EF1
MHCARIRTALSARLDGEELPPGLTDRRLDDHLSGCADCRLWQARARALAADVRRATAPTEGDAASVDALLARLRPGSAPG